MGLSTSGRIPRTGGGGVSDLRAALSPLEELHLAECAHISALDRARDGGFRKAAAWETQDFIGRAAKVLSVPDFGWHK